MGIYNMVVKLKGSIFSILTILFMSSKCIEMPGIQLLEESWVEGPSRMLDMCL